MEFCKSHTCEKCSEKLTLLADHEWKCPWKNKTNMLATKIFFWMFERKFRFADLKGCWYSRHTSTLKDPHIVCQKYYERKKDFKIIRHKKPQSKIEHPQYRVCLFVFVWGLNIFASIESRFSSFNSLFSLLCEEQKFGSTNAEQKCFVAKAIRSVQIH